MTQTYHHFFSTIVLLVLIPFIAGCGGSSGPKTYRVEGTVTHNGAPVEWASVAFQPDDSTGTSAGGRTDASGKYTLMASFGGEGTTPGTYTVTLSKTEAVSTGKKIPEADEEGRERMVDEKVMKEVLPTQYASVDKTPFKGITVEAKSPNTLDFKLE